jgi:hypothetical protein
MRPRLLALAVTILGCSCAQPGGGRIDPVLAAMAPADTILLSGIRMSEVRSTPLYTRMISQQRLSELDDFARQTNFDPRKDVTELLLASNGVDTLMLARGNFKIQTPAGMKKSIYKGATLFGKADGAYAILDATTAAAGPERAVRKAIDQKQSGKPGAIALLDRARALTGAGQIWFVSSGWGNLPDRLSADAGNLANMGRLLKSIETASGTVDLKSGLTASFTGQCRSDVDAKNLGDTARGLVGLGRLSVPENQPEMLRVFDAVKVEQRQRTVQVNASFSPDLLDKMLKMTEPRTRSGSGKIR